MMISHASYRTTDPSCRRRRKVIFYLKLEHKTTINTIMYGVYSAPTYKCFGFTDVKLCHDWCSALGDGKSIVILKLVELIDRSGMAYTRKCVQIVRVWYTPRLHDCIFRRRTIETFLLFLAKGQNVHVKTINYHTLVTCNSYSCNGLSKTDPERTPIVPVHTPVFVFYANEHDIRIMYTS